MIIVQRYKQTIRAVDSRTGTERLVLENLIFFSNYYYNFSKKCWTLFKWKFSYLKFILFQICNFPDGTTALVITKYHWLNRKAPTASNRIQLKTLTFVLSFQRVWFMQLIRTIPSTNYGLTRLIKWN